MSVWTTLVASAMDRRENHEPIPEVSHTHMKSMSEKAALVKKRQRDKTNSKIIFAIKKLGGSANHVQLLESTGIKHLNYVAHVCNRLEFDGKIHYTREGPRRLKVWRICK